MRFAQKAFFRCFVVCLSLLVSHQVYASCGDEWEHDANRAIPGCEQLNVTIVNNTNYTFVPDNVEFSVGGYVSGTTFPTLKPISTTTFSLKGGAKDYDGDGKTEKKDEVDVAMRYVAELSGKKTGTYFNAVFKKESCNITNTSYVEDDDSCYYKDAAGSCIRKTSCNICTSCGTTKKCDDITCDSNGICYEFCEYEVKCVTQTCQSDIDYNNVECSDSVQNPPVTSHVEPAAGLYESNLTNASNFTCQKSTVYQSSSDYNTPATTTLTINPSPIERLTITFPFNAQSPIAKLMSTTIYSNLSPKNLGGLGTYYSLTPVAVTDTTLAFSTLCNSASCPQP